MEINMAVPVFFLLLLIYVIMSEAFTVLFRLAGMTTEKARFQVISMLTNSGFTTSESEMILKDPLRRKLAMLTMLVGYAFTATIVSIAINVILRLNDSDDFDILRLCLPVLFWGCCFLLLIRTRRVKRQFDKMIERLGNRMIHSGKDKNSVVILDYIGEFVLAEVTVKRIPEPLQFRNITEAGIKEHFGLSVLMISRSGTLVSNVPGNIRVIPGDRLILFGPPSGIRSLFQ